MDIKLILAILASVLTLLAYVPYLKDIFRKETKPHLYTWLVWAITQGTATVALIKGGGGSSAISTTVGVILVLLILFLSFKYGTKNIKKSDTIVLIVALLAIVVWWQLNNIFLAVLMVTLIDGIGYIPTYRKTFQEPWSETPSFWLLIGSAMVLTLISNAEYNFLTVAYLSVLAVSNFALFLIITIRRKSVQKP